jgi:nicotinamidase-related amidase
LAEITGHGEVLLSGAKRGGAALLVVDVQECFFSKAVRNSDRIVGKINELLDDASCFDKVVYSKDAHPPNHISFASSHGVKSWSHIGKSGGGLRLTCFKQSSGLEDDGACCPTEYINKTNDCENYVCPGFEYDLNNPELVSNKACAMCKKYPDHCIPSVQAMWPDHCVGDSKLAQNMKQVENMEVIKKGQNQYVDAYSAFADNTKYYKTHLDETLKGGGIKKIYVVGVATDVCVKETVLDALNSTTTSGYEVVVVTDATAAVWVYSDANQDARQKRAFDEMKQRGASLMSTAEVLASCPGRRPHTISTENHAAIRRSSMS